MAWESGCTFSASEATSAGSGAVGLIQFMPQTAGQLHTTTAKLAAMTALAQLDYVDLYFRPWRGKLHNLGDLYCAILWPDAVGKPDSYVMFTEGGAHPALYLRNRGLDVDHSGHYHAIRGRRRHRDGRAARRRRAWGGAVDLQPDAVDHGAGARRRRQGYR